MEGVGGLVLVEGCAGQVQAEGGGVAEEEGDWRLLLLPLLIRRF